MQTPYGDIPDRFAKDMRPQDMHDFLQRRYSRRTMFKAAGASSAAATLGPMLWRQSAAFADSVPVTAQWIAFGANPATQMYVSWSAGSAGGSTVTPTKPQIQWGLDATYGVVQNADDSAQVPVPAGVSGEPAQHTFYTNALLSGLAPNTTYHYSVSNDGRTWTDDAVFTTASAGLANFRFTAFGDQAASVATAGAVTRMASWFKPAFQLIAGDLAYATPNSLTIADASSFRPAQWDKYLATVSSNGAASIPWQAAVGAHEVEPLGHFGYDGFLTRFPQPYDATSGSPVVRTFTYANVGVIQLDGNDLSAQETVNTGYSHGGQTTWLAKTLAKYRASGSAVDFIVVVCNCCLYSSNTNHGSDGGLRDAWGPLFDQYAVDLVISGHVHAYERTNPMRNGQPTRQVGRHGTVAPQTDGTTYICAGGGGNGLYRSWFGDTGWGDAGEATAPKVWRWSGGDTASGGTGEPVNVTDTAEDYSAVRLAAYSFLVIDVTAPTADNTSTTLRVRALKPDQSGTSITLGTAAVFDMVTLQRSSQSSLLTDRPR